MPAKKKVVRLQVIVDAVQHDGETHANGAQFEVAEAEAKELLKAGTVIKGQVGAGPSRGIRPSPGPSFR